MELIASLRFHLGNEQIDGWDCSAEMKSEPSIAKMDGPDGGQQGPRVPKFWRSFSFKNKILGSGGIFG